MNTIPIVDQGMQWAAAEKPPDLPGVYFAGDPSAKTIVVADRGQGVKTTIGRVVPEVKDDQEALLVAFTKVLSGRSGEKRGNGLKFVDSVVMERGWTLCFQSGAAKIVRTPREVFTPTQAELKIPGVLAILTY